MDRLPNPLAGMFSLCAVYFPFGLVPKKFEK
jgi:hypothetical protein